MSHPVIYIGRGRVKSGELRVRVKEMEDAVRRARDCIIQVTIERVVATRSLPQNAYYWSVVVARIATKYTESRPERPYSLEETHEILKAQFFDPHLVLEGKVPGQIINGLCIGVSTTHLNKLEFIEYLERIVWFAAEKLDLVIPDPNPNWKLAAEEEARNAA